MCCHYLVPTTYRVPEKDGGSVITSFGDRDLGTDAGVVPTTADQQVARGCQGSVFSCVTLLGVGRCLSVSVATTECQNLGN